MRKVLTALALVLALLLSTAPAYAAHGTLHGAGNQLVTVGGKAVRITGVNRSSMEYSCNGDGHWSVSDFAAIKSWGVNTVRLPLSSNAWLGNEGTGHEGNPCPNYQATVGSIVANASANGLYVLLTLAYVDPCSVVVTNPLGAGYDLPDQQTAFDFWASISSVYANNSYVLYDLYSEPHDVSWDQWRNGGEVTQKADGSRAGCTYQTPGMEALASYVRGLAPWRPLVVSGNSWGGDLSHIVTGYALDVPGVIYGVHIYPGPHTNNRAIWPSWFGNTMDAYPTVVTEFGQYDCRSNFISPVMEYAHEHAAGLMAWAFSTGTCKRPSLIGKTWTTAPNAYGAVVRRFFLGLGKDCPTCS